MILRKIDILSVAVFRVNRPFIAVGDYLFDLLRFCYPFEIDYSIKRVAAQYLLDLHLNKESGMEAMCPTVLTDSFSTRTWHRVDMLGTI